MAYGIQAQRIVNADTGEVELYCHSTQRQKKEEGMHRQVGERLEAELQKLAAGLHKKRTTTRLPHRAHHPLPAQSQ